MLGVKIFQKFAFGLLALNIIMLIVKMTKSPKPECSIFLHHRFDLSACSGSRFYWLTDCCEWCWLNRFLFRDSIDSSSGSVSLRILLRVVGKTWEAANRKRTTISMILREAQDCCGLSLVSGGSIFENSGQMIRIHSTYNQNLVLNAVQAILISILKVEHSFVCKLTKSY